ncbi:MAG: hypothetical protein ACON3Z_14610 [Bradymonadia bacterium]
MKTSLLFGVMALVGGCASDDGSGGGTTPDLDAAVMDSRMVDRGTMEVDATPDATNIPDFTAPIVDQMVVRDQSTPDLMPLEDMGPMDAACNCVGNQICNRGECLEPDICEAHRDCLGARLCEDGMCRDGCVDNSGCPDGFTCDLATQTCTNRGPCMSDDQCGENICVDGFCAERCRDDDACRGRQTCELNSGRCLEPEDCNEDLDCNDGRRCVDRACIDPCREDSNCAGAQRCVDGVCAEPDNCTSNLDCTGDRVCVGAMGAAQCQNPCSVVPCRENLFCDRLSGQCLEAEPCQDETGCFDGRVCLNERCDEPCMENADCRGAQSCVDGVCTEPDFCNGPLDCNPGRVCVDGGCRDSCERVPCEGALLCSRETGQCVEAAPCLDNEGCFDGRVCEAGNCNEPCLEPADCPGGMNCINSRCEEPDFCRGAFDCHVGRRCVEGACRDECVDGACIGTRVCDPTGLCVEGEGCAADRDCDGERRCRVEAGVCADICMVDAQCRGNLECGPDGLCREPRFCVEDDECAGDRLCLFATCYDVECQADGNCPGDELCVGFVCVADRPGECACPEGWACDDGHCVQPAPCDAFNGEAGCPEGTMCTPGGHCAQCAVDADCARGVCDAGDCVDPFGCEADEDCLDGRTCSNGFCDLPRNACEDDEVNNGDFGNAEPLLYATIPNLVACEGPGDWFTVNDPIGARVIVRFDAPSTRLSVSAFSWDQIGRTPVDVGEPLAGEAWVNVGPGLHYIRVDAKEGGAGDYTITTEGGVTCLDDPYDRPWRNDAPESAREVRSGQFSGTLCDGDVDHFIYPGEAGSVEVSIEGPVIGTFNGQALPRTVFGPGNIQVEGEGEYTLRITPDDRPVARCLRAPQVAVNSRFNVAADRAVNSFQAECHFQDGNDVVFAFEPPARGVARAEIVGLDPDVRLRIMKDCSAEPIACSDDFGSIAAAVDNALHYLVVDGGFNGDVLLSFEPESDVCGEAAPAPIGEQFDVDLGQRSPDVAGGCLPVTNGQAVYRLDVQVDSRVTINLASDDPNAVASIRTVCSAVEGEVACQQNTGNPRRRFLPAGEYSLVFNADAPVTAQINIEPGGQPGPPTPAEACEDAIDYQFDQLNDARVLADDDNSFAPACRGVQQPDRVYRVTIEEPTTLIGRLDAPDPATSMLVYGDCSQEPINCGFDRDGLRQDLDPGTYYVVIDGPNENGIELVLDPPPGQGGGATPAEACERAPVLEHGVPAPAESLGRSDNFSAECSPAGSRDRAFSIVLDRRATINARLAIPEPNTRLLLYSDCEGEAIACGNNFGELSQRVPAGEYFIIIDGNNEGDILVELDPPPGAPVIETPEQACAAATPINTGTVAIQVDENADNLFDEGCGFVDRPENAYRIEVATPGVLRALLTEPAAVAMPTLYQDCSGEALACASEEGILEQEVVPGTYYIVVEGQYAGDMDIDIAEVQGPCDGAQVIEPGVDTAVDFTLVPPPYAGDCLQGFNPQALFYFDLAEASRVRLSSSGNANVQLSTRSTCDEPATQTACEAAINAVSVADLEAGRHYVIVESDGQTTLNLEINPDEGGDSPFVDFCAPAERGELLPVGTELSLNGTTLDGSDAFDGTRCPGVAAGGKDKAFLFELDAPATINATAQGVGFVPVLKLYQDGCFGDLSCSQVGNPELSIALEAGTYALVVEGVDADAGGEFTLDLTVE